MSDNFQAQTNKQALLYLLSKRGTGLPALENPAEAPDILIGKEVLDASGKKLVGTMADNGALIIVLDTDNPECDIPEGYHNGGGKVSYIAEVGSGNFTNCDYLFYYGARTEQFDDVMANVPYIDRAYLMFADCGRNGAADAFELPASFYAKLAKATYVYAMFNYAYVFSKFDGITFENKVNVQNFITNTKMTSVGDITIPEAEGNSIASMLYGNSLLETVGNITVGDNAAVAAGALFDGCVALKTIGALNFKPSGSTQNMFRSCRSLETAPSVDWSEATSMHDTFAGCTAMKGEITIGKTKVNFNYGLQAFSKCTSLEGILDVHWVGTGYHRSIAPIGTADAPSALKRFTFHPEFVCTGLESFSLAYCSFERTGMVEFLNSLPDVSGSTLSAAYKAITITGNPCITGTLTDGTACDVLTDEDRAIATNKGWTLVE